MTGFAFGKINRFIHGQFATGIERKGFKNPFEARRRRLTRNQTGSGNRASIDHRVTGTTGFRIKADGIEGVARRLYPDALQGFIAAIVFQSEAIDEGLGDGLDGEFLVRVTNFVNGTVGRDETDAEQIRIGFGKLGNIGRYVAAVVAGALTV